MASSTDQRRDLKFMLRLVLSSVGVATSDSSLNIPSVSATLPWSECLLLSALVFLVPTSLSYRDWIDAAFHFSLMTSLGGVVTWN